MLMGNYGAFCCKNLRASCACVMHTSTAMLNHYVYDVKYNIIRRKIQKTAAPATTRNHIHPYSFYLALFRCQMSTVVLFSVISHCISTSSRESCLIHSNVCYACCCSPPVRLINPSVWISTLVPRLRGTWNKRDTYRVIDALIPHLKSNTSSAQQ